ncbi:hypothetical protein [Mycobacteroides abscessus]|uniref:hypothetical protein n=1 Tax=Mycobacteroides abscessus TaxID=36809 RepID=UPI000C2638D3|nr:hypothetical protein [Mycobacteroides abscessus]
MFKNIFDGALQAGQLAQTAAGYLDNYIPGDWDIRKNADPELFEGIPDEPSRFKGHPVNQDPKIVSEASPIGLDLAGFLQTTFGNFQTLAQGEQTTNQEPTTVTDPAAATLKAAEAHLKSSLDDLQTPEKPEVDQPDRPTAPTPTNPKAQNEDNSG